MGFSLQQIRIGLLNPLIGNAYAASSPLGLAAVLDEAKVGDRILVASYGSGAGSDALSIRVLEAVTEKRKMARPVKEMIANSLKIDYSTYAKFREKFLR